MKKPNILLMVMDAARAKNFSCYGYGKQTTPNIDKIAREGTLYKYAISPSSWTFPSHASMFTGLYPSEHDALGVDKSNQYLDQKNITLAEVLKKQGYSTVAFSNNSWISNVFGLTKGFDESHIIFNKFFHGNVLDMDHFSKNRKYKSGIRRFLEMGKAILTEGNPLKNIANGILVKFSRFQYVHLFMDDGANETNYNVKKWICDNKKKCPFFMFINYMECHEKYLPPFKYWPKEINIRDGIRVNKDPMKYIFGKVNMNESDFKILESLYDGEYKYLDYRIGQLYDFLDQEGILDDTIIIITSDHGDNIGDHNLMGHALCVYDTLLRCPLIIRYPKKFPAGKIVDKRVQTLDIFKTIMRVLDEKIGEMVEGVSLIPEDIEQESKRIVISEWLGYPSLPLVLKRFPDINISDWDNSLRAIYVDDFKFILNSNGLNELYNIDKDPEEKQNIVQDHPQVANILEEELCNWIKNIEHKKHNKEKIGLKIKRLKYLGRI